MTQTRRGKNKFSAAGSRTEVAEPEMAFHKKNQKPKERIKTQFKKKRRRSKNPHTQPANQNSKENGSLLKFSISPENKQIRQWLLDKNTAAFSKKKTIKERKNEVLLLKGVAIPSEKKEIS